MITWQDLKFVELKTITKQKVYYSNIRRVCPTNIYFLLLSAFVGP